MMEKIKAFFNNKVVITIEGIVIALGAAGLILAGNDVVDIQNIPAAAGGVLVAIEAVITVIQGLFKKSE